MKELLSFQCLSALLFVKLEFCLVVELVFEFFVLVVELVKKLWENQKQTLVNEFCSHKRSKLRRHSDSEMHIQIPKIHICYWNHNKRN